MEGGRGKEGGREGGGKREGGRGKRGRRVAYLIVTIICGYNIKTLRKHAVFRQ